jgi:hypothetical protein
LDEKLGFFNKKIISEHKLYLSRHFRLFLAMKTLENIDFPKKKFSPKKNALKKKIRSNAFLAKNVKFLNKNKFQKTLTGSFNKW